MVKRIIKVTTTCLRTQKTTVSAETTVVKEMQTKPKLEDKIIEHNLDQISVQFLGNTRQPCQAVYNCLAYSDFQDREIRSDSLDESTYLMKLRQSTLL